MSNTLKLSLLLAAGLSCLAAPPEGYMLKWSDEFAGENLDLTKWNYRTDSKYQSTQTPANVVLEDGRLVILLKKEQAGGKEHTGGGVISKPVFRYGYYEARMRILAGPGWHSSFWLFGSGTSGGLELDVIENDSIKPNTYSLVTHKYLGEEHTAHGAKFLQTHSLTDFHVFGCEYTPSAARYFLDGVVVQTLDIAGFPHPDVDIRLTSLGSHPRLGAVDETRLPGRVEYDYVRFYEEAK